MVYTKITGKKKPGQVKAFNHDLRPKFNQDWVMKAAFPEETNTSNKDCNLLRDAVNDVSRLKQEVESKDVELVRIKGCYKDLEKLYSEMKDANQDQIKKIEDVCKQVESKEAEVVKLSSTVECQSKIIEDLQSQIVEYEKLPKLGKKVPKLEKQLKASAEKMKGIMGNTIGAYKMLSNRKRKAQKSLIGEFPKVNSPEKVRKLTRSISSNILHVKEDGNEILKGDYYTRTVNGKTLKTSQSCLKLPISSKSYSEAKQKTKKKRLESLKKTVETLAVDQEGYSHIFKDFLVMNKDLVQEACNDPKLGITIKKLSEKETLELKRALNWSDNDLKRNISALNSLNKNYLASSHSVRKEKNKILKNYSFESGTWVAYKNTQLKETVKAVFSKVSSLKEIVLSYLEEFKDRENELMEIDGRHVICFSGDKGGTVEASGNFNKYTFNIMKVKNPQDFSSFCVYAMTNAPDNYENARIFNQQYFSEILELMNMVSPLGKEILCILGGDFLHCGTFCGHQGAGSTFPSFYTMITRSHLQDYHKTFPDTPHNHSNPECIADIRDTKEMMENSMVALTNNPENHRKDGKHANSIIGPALFPLKYGLVEQIAVPSLHLTSGIFCKLEDKFRNECGKLDGLSDEAAECQEKLKSEIDEMLKEEDSMINVLKNLGEEWKENKHIIDAFQSNTRKVKKPCDAQKCVLTTKKAKDTKWIRCDASHHKNRKKDVEIRMHIICEGIPIHEYNVLEALGDPYSCLSCQELEIEDKLKEILKTLENLNDEIEQTDRKFLTNRTKRVSKEDMYKSKTGPIVSSINTAMKEMKISAESYHGNIFTATTSMKFLDNHEVFTSFISDETVRKKWEDLFKLFYSISRKLLSVKQIKVEERTELNQELEELGRLWIHGVDKKISPKLDTLIMVVPKIIDAMDGYCGALSEQNIERIHNVTNQHARKTHNISNKADRTEYIMKMLQVDRICLNSEIGKSVRGQARTFTCNCCGIKVPYTEQKCPECETKKRGLKRKKTATRAAS